MPYFYFSDYQTVLARPSFLVSELQYLQLMQQTWVKYPDYKAVWDSISEKYDWKFGIPKQAVFLKLNPDITADELEIIANGIRSQFFGKSGVLLTKKEIIETAKSVDIIFNIFVAIIAVIALSIAFFLLLISMTSNINEACWEYGVLRSMGVTMQQGQRIYIYEAFMIVTSSSILGIMSGFLTAMLVSSQFYMFIELPMKIKFPWILLGIMLAIAVVTTFVAVYLPVKQINKRQIASVLKAGAA